MQNLKNPTYKKLFKRTVDKEVLLGTFTFDNIPETAINILFQNGIVYFKLASGEYADDILVVPALHSATKKDQIDPTFFPKVGTKILLGDGYYTTPNNNVDNNDSVSVHGAYCIGDKLSFVLLPTGNLPMDVGVNFENSCFLDENDEQWQEVMISADNLVPSEWFLNNTLYTY